MSVPLWLRLAVVCAGLTLAVPGQGDAQLRIVWPDAENTIDAADMERLCSNRGVMGQRFRVYFDGPQEGLYDALGGSFVFRQYVVRVDGRQVQCRSSARHPQNGNCLWDGNYTDTPEGGLVSTEDIYIDASTDRWAFVTGTHVVSVELVGMNLGSSAPYTMSCGGDSPPPPPSQPPAALGNARLAWELNPASGEGFDGVVADGATDVRLRFRLPGAVRAQVETSLGHFVDDAGGPLSDGTLPLVNGEAIIRFVPPEYLTRTQMTERLALRRGEDAIEPDVEDNPWAAVADIRFTWSGAEGQTGERSVTFQVLRPPVVYVHGFQGTAETWPDFMRYMNGQGFAGRADSYYNTNERGEQDVRAQSVHLHNVVVDEMQVYGANGYKISKVDVVAHSMGGLVARFYAKGLRVWDGGVRKIVTIATPHHGIRRGDRNFGGWLYAWATGKHRAMKEDVHFQSGFLQELNAGEGAGQHLNNTVQYGNIYVEPDDGVVFAGSAQLEAVEQRTFFEELSHTAFRPFANGDILAWPTARGQVNQWLTRDLQRQRLTTLRVVVAAGPGAVTAGHLPSEGSSMAEITEAVGQYPHPLSVGHSVRTEGGPAVIHWTLNNQVLASLELDAGAAARIGPWLPNDINVVMVEGKALFKTNRRPGEPAPSFSVILAAGLYGPREYDQETPAVLQSFGTTFAVSADNGVFDVHVLDGRVEAVDERVPGSPAVMLEPGDGVRLQPQAQPESISPPSAPWWNDLPQRSLTAGAQPGGPPGGQPGNQGQVAPPLQPETRLPPAGLPPSRPSQSPLNRLPAPGGTPEFAGFYGMESYPVDGSIIQEGINGRIQRGFAPVGLSVKNGQVHVLYLGGEVLAVDEWQLDPYTSTDALSAGITDRMNQGLLPTGVSWDAGTFYVLYVRTGITASAWQIVTSAIDLGSVQRDIQPFLEQGYTPFGVGLTDTQYLTLLVQLTEELAQGWTIEGGQSNQVGTVIEGQMFNNYFPWGLIYAEVANVLFLLF